MFYTVRPLPWGQYRFYHTVFDPNRLTICGGDAMPEAMRKSAEDIVEVTAPEGVVHEAFFDPVASGDAVGAGGADGVLTGAGFTLWHSTLWRATRNGCHTIIRRIEWESGRVVMRLEPDDNALAGHHVDFISLDGSVALRLDFDDAVEATSGGAPALAWSVRNQPWSEGDLLMLRISRSEANLIGASGDAECPPPAPPHLRLPRRQALGLRQMALQLMHQRYQFAVNQVTLGGRDPGTTGFFGDHTESGGPVQGFQPGWCRGRQSDRSGQGIRLGLGQQPHPRDRPGQVLRRSQSLQRRSRSGSTLWVRPLGLQRIWRSTELSHQGTGRPNHTVRCARCQ